MEVMHRFNGADVAWKVGRIMLKFRPIAPKPVTVGSVMAPVDIPKVTTRRGKRKNNSTQSATKRGRKSSKKVVVTLPLMPETPERKDEGAHVTDNVPVVVPPGPVGSWVTVEEVTDMWREGGPWEERTIKDVLERDTCPGFISDGFDRVTWTNSAYREMVVGTTEVDGEVSVALMTKGLVPEGGGVTCFTCRVRVRYACRRKGTVSTAAPCDVWRVEGGKLVWRLDVKAALSLGLGC